MLIQYFWLQGFLPLSLFLPVTFRSLAFQLLYVLQLFFAGKMSKQTNKQ
jgi:hypothetical protein